MNRNPFIDYPLLADYVFGNNYGQTWSSALSNSSFDTAKIVLYPNPAKDYFTVSGITSEATIEIYSALGQKVFQENFAGEARLNFNLSSGIYLAKITSDGFTTTKKVIIE